MDANPYIVVQLQGQSAGKTGPVSRRTFSLQATRSRPPEVVAHRSFTKLSAVSSIRQEDGGLPARMCDVVTLPTRYPSGFFATAKTLVDPFSFDGRNLFWRRSAVITT
jgi:hypothetical protein